MKRNQHQRPAERMESLLPPKPRFGYRPPATGTAERSIIARLETPDREYTFHATKGYRSSRV